MSTTFAIVIIVICLVLSAFFSASEMALSSLSRVRIEHLAENGNRAAKRVLGILDHFENALSAILVGNNLVNIAASSLGSIVAIRAAGEGYTWAATLILTVCVIIFGETIPKILSQKNATRFSLGLSGPVRGLSLVLWPVTFLTVGLVSLLTRGLKGDEETDEDLATEELHSIIETAEDEDVLDEDTSELVSAAIDFSDIMAQEVMTARVDLVAVDIEDTEEEIYDAIGDCGHSRIPVCEGGLDNIIGILHVNHYLKALTSGEEHADLRSMLLPVEYVYKAMKLPAVLTQLQESRQQLAVVTDEYGGTEGIVSLEDVLEELVGEIWDETDTVENEVIEHADGSRTVDGDMLLADYWERENWDEDSMDFESETVGGWCIEMLGGFPEVGESFTYRGLVFTVTETGERRVLEVKVQAQRSCLDPQMPVNRNHCNKKPAD